MKAQVRPRHARRVLRGAGAAALALTLAAGLAACSGGDSPESTADASPSATQEQESGPVTVLDQTKIRLVTAQQTFESRGLVVEVVDVTGQGRAIDDPTQWVVVTQTPTTGTLEPGETVRLEVRRTDDPVS